MDLVAISPVTRIVPLGSAAVEVTGLSLRKLSSLIATYPELVPLAAGGEVQIARLLADAPDAALGIFSIGLVGPGRSRRWRLLFWRKVEPSVKDDAEFLAAFDQAPAGQQIDVLGTIYDLTFKGERVIPFLGMLVGAMTKPKQDIPPEPGPSPSADLSDPAIPQTTSGT